MQDQNTQLSTFLHRTDKLAVRLNIRVEDLPEILGMSRRTLFACRSAESAVTAKSLLKLEAAERSAGILSEEVPPKADSEESSADLNQIPEGSAELLHVLNRIATALEALVKQSSQTR